MNSEIRTPVTLVLYTTVGLLLAVTAWSAAKIQDPDQRQGLQDERTRAQQMDRASAELDELHSRFRSQVERAFREAAKERSGQEAGQEQKEQKGLREREGLQQGGQQEKTQQGKDQTASYDTSQLMFTSLGSGMLLAGAPADSSSRGTTEAATERPLGGDREDQARSGGGQDTNQDQGQRGQRERRVLGAILIHGPGTKATGPGRTGGLDRERDREDRQGRQDREPGDPSLAHRSGGLEAGFYAVRTSASGTTVELVGQDGRVHRAIPLEKDQAHEGEEHEEEESGARREVRTGAFRSTGDHDWEQTYGRILTWIAPKLGS